MFLADIMDSGQNDPDLFLEIHFPLSARSSPQEYGRMHFLYSTLLPERTH